MHILYKIDESQIESQILENQFLKKVEQDFSKVIKTFSMYERVCDDFLVWPNSKNECQWMFSAYCKLFEANQPLPEWLKRYFNFCFDLVLRGVPPQQAFGLNNPRHRPKQFKTAERNEYIYLEISKLMQKDVKLFDAALELSEKYDLHESTIQNIYSAVKKSTENKLDIQAMFELNF